MQSLMVTGAASGIGRELVGRLLARGDRVVALDVNAELLGSLEGSDEQLRRRTLDVRDAGAWKTLFDEVSAEWGCPDALVNVAGVLRHGYCWEVTPEDLDLQLDINTKGVILGTAEAARRMRERGSGRIINVASLAGVSPAPGLPVYCASKFAVRGFSLAAAAELLGSGVTVTVVCPDAVQTPMLDQQRGHEQTAVTFSGSRPLTVDEVCQAIIDKALARGPLEVLLPASRGAMAKTASLMPGLVPKLYASLRARGLRQQAGYGKPGS